MYRLTMVGESAHFATQQAALYEQQGEDSSIARLLAVLRHPEASLAGGLAAASAAAACGALTELLYQLSDLPALFSACGRAALDTLLAWKRVQPHESTEVGSWLAVPAAAKLFAYSLMGSPFAFKSSSEISDLISTLALRLDTGEQCTLTVATGMRSMVWIALNQIELASYISRNISFPDQLVFDAAAALAAQPLPPDEFPAALRDEMLQAQCSTLMIALNLLTRRQASRERLSEAASAIVSRLTVGALLDVRPNFALPARLSRTLIPLPALRAGPAAVAAHRAVAARLAARRPHPPGAAAAGEARRLLSGCRDVGPGRPAPGQRAGRAGPRRRGRVPPKPYIRITSGSEKLSPFLLPRSPGQEHAPRNARRRAPADAHRRGAGGRRR